MQAKVSGDGKVDDGEITKNSPCRTGLDVLYCCPVPISRLCAPFDFVDDAHNPLLVDYGTLSAVLTRVLRFPLPPQMARGVEPDDVTFSSLVATTRDGSERSPERGLAVSLQPDRVGDLVKHATIVYAA